MPKSEVEFYMKGNGEQPAKEFLLSLNIKMRAKMMSTISILQDHSDKRIYQKEPENTAGRDRKSKEIQSGSSEKKGERRMNNKYNEFLEEQLRDPEFRKEYEALQPERAVIRAIIEARRRSGLTQKELAERTGIAQGDISKLENGNANPSIRTLQRLANGMGMTLKVEFIPRKAVNG